ncbi:MAG: alpha/beta hydrolase [Propionibacteriales bacterium]|nr:alpha/beta hydrolase [Propionibacteriales bacterium]
MAAVDQRVVTLRDGRELAIAVSGPADGVPLLYHHGTPGCLYQPAASQAECATRGLRYLTYSRAGAEGSTRHQGRTVADVAADMEDVLDALGVERCLVAGKSGGGPHALATAALLPDRVAAVISIAGCRPYGDGFLDGMGSDNIEEFELALQGEEALRPFVLKHREALKDADGETLVRDLATLLPEVDRQVLTSNVGADTVAVMVGGVQVPDAWIDDDLAFTRDWGFDLSQISVPTYVWQGSEDLMVPFHHGQWLAEHLPGAVAHLEQGEGHFSVAVGALGRMLDEVLVHVAGD